MGTVVSKAANGFGSLLGNAFAAPFKSIFGGSCEGVCSGTWDITCFIEHLCISNIVKLLMVLGLCYITLLFFYLMFKLGICQCIGRSLCKMCWAACETYWFALEDITCFLWHKLRNIKRVNRRRRRRRRRPQFRDVEIGSSSSSEDGMSFDTDQLVNYRERRLIRKRKDRPGHSLFASRNGSENRHGSWSHRHHRHHLRLSTREASVHVKGRSHGAKKHSGQLRRRKQNNLQRGTALFKRRRFK